MRIPRSVLPVSLAIAATVMFSILAPMALSNSDMVFSVAVAFVDGGAVFLEALLLSLFSLFTASSPAPFLSQLSVSPGTKKNSRKCPNGGHQRLEVKRSGRT